LIQNTNIRRFIVPLSNFTRGFLFLFFICAIFREDAHQTVGPVKEKEDREDDLELLLHECESRAYENKDAKEKIEADDNEGKIFGKAGHAG